MGKVRTSGTNTEKKTKKGNTHMPVKSAVAERGKALTPIREGSLLQVENELQDMEKKAEISIGILENADDVVLSELYSDEDQEGETEDCDLDTGDEDDFRIDDSHNDYQTSVSGNGEWEDDNTAFITSQKFEIYVRSKIDGTVSCRIRRDSRIGFDSVSPAASDKLNELANRYEVLERIGEWLAANRKRFLTTFDLWDYAEQALDEAKHNVASVVQKDFIDIVGLRCDASLFSRYIKNVVLTSQIEYYREDGSIGCRDYGRMEISNLFQDVKGAKEESKRAKVAKCAWVAHAFRDFCRTQKIYEDMTKAAKVLCKAKASQTGKEQRVNTSLFSLNSPRIVASRLCELAGVSGGEVVAMFREKLCEA